MKDPHLAHGHPITDKVEVDLYMLRPLVLDGVGGEVDRTDVVAVDQCAPGGRSVQLSKQLHAPNQTWHHFGQMLINMA
jgi:hypothetical protein